MRRFTIGFYTLGIFGGVSLGVLLILRGYTEFQADVAGGVWMLICIAFAQLLLIHGRTS